MLIDEKGKLFGKVSIIDIIAVLVLAALVLGTVYKFGGFGSMASDKKYDTLQYMIQVKGVRQQTIDAMVPGDSIYDSKTGSFMGKIISKEAKPAMDQVIKADGTVVLAAKPERFDAYVTIEVPGVESSNSYLANGNRELNNESTIVMSTRMLIVEAKIIDVKNLSRK